MNVSITVVDSAHGVFVEICDQKKSRFKSCHSAEFRLGAAVAMRCPRWPAFTRFRVPSLLTGKRGRGTVGRFCAGGKRWRAYVSSDRVISAGAGI